LSEYVLGLSCFYHDSAAALLRDGTVVAACQEERLSRKKHDSDFPAHAVKYVLREAGISPEQLDAVGFYDKPLLKFERMLSTYVATFPRSFGSFRKAMPVWMKEKLWVPSLIRKELKPYKGPILFAEHHMSHAASCFLVSPFEEAAILTVDGVGEWATSSFGVGKGNDITLFKEIRFPHSLGLLYSAITAYLGFEVNDGEYKVMGLAPYGEPRLAAAIRQLVLPGPGGQYRLDLRYFDFLERDRMYSDRLVELLGAPPRPPESEILPFHQDVARSLQQVLEEMLLDKARWLHAQVPSENLCMAGGVALNCVANGRLLREGPFARLFVQPAASDAGGCLGAAALAHARRTGERPAQGRLEHMGWGPAAPAGRVAALVAAAGVPALDFRGRTAELLEATVDRLAAGKVVGWFQGRMEFGPRALGARSILADPRDPDMRDRINALV